VAHGSSDRAVSESPAGTGSGKSSSRGPAVLVIAATDSSGGAGLTRDVRALTDFSVDALCVVTAVTAQSDRRVTAVHHVPPEIIRAQIAAAFATRAIGAVKVGMLGTEATVEAVVEGLAAAMASGRATTGGAPIVVDPVLVSTSGGVLLDAGGRAALLERLFPRAALVTPNVPEVAALLGDSLAADEAALIEQGRRLLKCGPAAILLKGGHAGGEHAVDLLIRSPEGSVERIPAKRVSGSSRGTGCALASAIAAGLAVGKSLPDACREAKNYVLQMLEGKPTQAPGRG
jgi:hydroxymethylpyrimidine/phosphomethylpyrimidine kinase